MTAPSVSSKSFGGSFARIGPSFERVVAGAWMDYALIATALLVCFATPLLMLRLGTRWSPGLQAALALAAAAAVGAAVLPAGRSITRGAAHLLWRLRAMPLWLVIASGLVLRLAWSLCFPAQAASDGATYLGLASRMAAGEPYATAGTMAYWPVGYPLYLSVWFSVFGDGKPVWLASNYALYLVAALGIARLGSLLAGADAGKLAAFVFALWPNYLANTATPEKEMLLVALLPWVLALLVETIAHRFSYVRASAAGALLGFAILAQPSLQLLPFGCAILLAKLVPGGRQGLLAAVTLVLAAAAVIAPWTLRNYATFDRFVLVSTNGGGNLYRANNAYATGGYTERGVEDLSSLDEISHDQRGRALALEWIGAHPARFAALAWEKQLRFAGDDAVGVYGTLKAGKASPGDGVYAALKACANAFWVLIWLAVAALCLQARAGRWAVPRLLRLPFWLWLYLATLHSVFESAGKYHVPVAWVLCILLAGYAAAAAQPRAAA